jgi:hypothetical protein
MFGGPLVTSVAFNNADNSGSSPDFAVTGALYFPAATVTLNGGGSSGCGWGGCGGWGGEGGWGGGWGGSSSSGIDCFVVVAKQIVVQGSNSLFLTNNCSSYNGSPIPTVAIVQ